MTFRSSRARGRIRISGIGAVHAGLLARLRQHIGHDERHGLTAALAVDERLAKRRDFLLVLFQKPHRGADDLAFGFEAAGLELPRTGEVWGSLVGLDLPVHSERRIALSGPAGPGASV